MAKGFSVTDTYVRRPISEDFDNAGNPNHQEPPKRNKRPPNNYDGSGGWRETTGNTEPRGWTPSKSRW